VQAPPFITEAKQLLASKNSLSGACTHAIERQLFCHDIMSETTTAMYPSNQIIACRDQKLRKKVHIDALQGSA